jgi:hypothetical protein
MQQGTAMQDAVNVVKAATASSATGAGIAMWLGANLPFYVQCLTAFTLTCTAIVFMYRFVQWVHRLIQ